MFKRAALTYVPHRMPIKTARLTFYSRDCYCLVALARHKLIAAGILLEPERVAIMPVECVCGRCRAENKMKPGRYQDGDGLILIVKESGSRSWLLRAQVEGKRRDFDLGSARTVSLADAREKAAALRKLFRSGVDPVAAKKAARLERQTIPTFRLAAETAHGELVAGWRNIKHRNDWLASLKSHAFATLGDIRIDQIEAPMVRDALFCRSGWKSLKRLDASASGSGA